MIKGKDIYEVVAALVPLYVALILGYGADKYPSFPFHIIQQPLHHEFQVLSRGLTSKVCDFGRTFPMHHFHEVG